MRLHAAALAGALFLSGLAAAQDEPLSSSSELALEATLGKLNARYPITFTFDLEKVTAPPWRQGMRRIYESEFKQAAQYLDIFSEEFNKYPPELIKAGNLKAVVFCAGLDVGGQVRKASPDYVNETLYLDIHALGGDNRYARHVVHHEFYHMLEEEWNGSAYYKDPNWSLINDPEWKYGTGGALMQGGNVWAYTHPAPGFINAYSTAAVEEDKAEVWATLFVPESWRLVEPWLKDDPILRAKFAYMREFARQKAPEMTPDFWDSLVKEPVG